MTMSGLKKNWMIWNTIGQLKGILNDGLIVYENVNEEDSKARRTTKQVRNFFASN